MPMPYYPPAAGAYNGAYTGAYNPAYYNQGYNQGYNGGYQAAPTQSNNGRDFYRQITHTSRHGHHRSSRNPTRYIVNDGTLVVDPQSLRKQSTYIYNAPTATLYFNKDSSSGHHNHGTTTHYYPPATTTPALPRTYRRSLSYHGGTGSSPYLSSCLGCHEFREVLSEGYCRRCNADSYDRRYYEDAGQPYQVEYHYRPKSSKRRGSVYYTS